MGVLDQNSQLYTVRGRIGSLVVSSNATTSYVKSAATPRQPNTTRQQSQRNALGLIMMQWAALTTPQRAAWAVAAANALYTRSNWFGNPYQMTGQQLFVSINRVAYAASLGYVLVPSLLAFPAPPPASSFVLNSTTSGLHSTWQFLAAVPAGVASIMLRAKFARGWSVLQSSFKPAVVMYRFPAAVNPLNIESYLVQSFGSLPLQFTIFFEVNSVDVAGRVTLGPVYTQQSTGV